MRDTAGRTSKKKWPENMGELSERSAARGKEECKRRKCHKLCFPILHSIP